jgi:hypothetical protein
MKTTVIVLSVFLAGSAVFLFGCSKASKPGPIPTNGSQSASSSGSAAAGPIDLKLKWQTGKQYDMQMNLDQSSDINVPNQPIHQDLKMMQDLHYSPLKDLGDGGHQVELEFDRENLNLTQNGKEIVSYDSTQKTASQPNSPAGPVAAVMGAMLGVPLDYTFAADGTVEKIDGFDSLTNRIAAAVPDHRQRMAFQQLYDEETLKQYGSFSQSLPDHPVSIGDSWSSSHDINTPAGVVTLNATYTFKNWEQHDGHNCAHLVMSGEIKTKSTSAAAIGAVVDIRKSSLSGDSWFDPDLGMFVDSNFNQDLTMNITTRQMALTQHMKENVEMSLLSINSR